MTYSFIPLGYSYLLGFSIPLGLYGVLPMQTRQKSHTSCFNVEVNLANIGTLEIRETLEKELCDWTAAEGIIYSITIETLVNASQFIIATEGAGRAQLQHLEYVSPTPRVCVSIKVRNGLTK